MSAMQSRRNVGLHQHTPIFMQQEGSPLRRRLMNENSSKQRVAEDGYTRERSRVCDSNLVVDALIHDLVENRDRITRVVV